MVLESRDDSSHRPVLWVKAIAVLLTSVLLIHARHFRSARHRGVEVGFRQYFRLGLPITILTTLSGIGVLLLETSLAAREW